MICLLGLLLIIFSQAYLANERRHNYTTPKSFLELINLYVKLLKMKHEELEGKMKRLENGLEKLRVTAVQVGNTGQKCKVA